MENRNHQRRLGFRKSLVEQLETRDLLSANLPFGTDLIENGDFENVVGVVANDWQGDPSPLSTRDFGASPDRGKVAVISEGLSASQTVDVVAGQSYLLTFDFRLAQKDGAGALLSNFDSGQWTATNRWQTGSVVVEAEESSLDVLFSSTEDLFLDHVRLVPIEASSLVNSGFEETPSIEEQYFKGKDLPGWNAVGDRRIKNLNIKPSGGSDGGRYLNVDGNADLLELVFQEVATEPGRHYFVTFDVRSPSVEDVMDSELSVRWNGEFCGIFRGQTQWQNVGFFAEADSDISRLVFREPGGRGITGDASGPHVDNVKVYKVVPGVDSLTINDPQAVDREFIEDNGPIKLFSEGLDLGNSVVDQLTGAVITIQNRQDLATEETLTVDEFNNGIEARFDAANARLRLTGRASLSDYETVLKSLVYKNSSQDPNETQRDIRVKISYGLSTSSPDLIGVNVTAINDRPTITPIADQSVTVLTSYSFQVNASDIESPDDLTYSISSSGTALGVGDPAPTISETGEIQWIPQQSGTVEITVTIKDPEGLVAQRKFEVSAELDATVPSNFSPFSGARQLSNVFPTLRDSVYESAPELNLDLDKEYRAILGTDSGQIEILLYDNETPDTVNSFVNLARDGFYDGLTFFRVVSLIGLLDEGFIAQAGDPQNTGVGGPGYNFDDENLGSSVFDKPVIAMANRGKGTSSNGSQFFLTYDDKVTHLNGNHTIFGEIVGGMDAVNSIIKRQPGSDSSATVIRSVKILTS